MEQRLVEEAAGREMSKTHEKLEVDVGKAHKRVEGRQEKDNDFQNKAKPESTRFSEKQEQTEERKVKLPLKPVSKMDVSKRESQDFDSTRSSPHETVHGEENQGSIGIKQKQSKTKKEKTPDELKNKGNQFQNWETGDKEGSATKQVNHKQMFQNQSEKDARKLPWWDESKFNKEEMGNRDFVHYHQ